MSGSCDRMNRMTINLSTVYEPVSGGPPRRWLPDPLVVWVRSIAVLGV